MPATLSKPMLNSIAPDVIAAFEKNARLHHRIGGTYSPSPTQPPHMATAKRALGSPARNKPALLEAKAYADVPDTAMESPLVTQRTSGEDT